MQTTVALRSKIDAAEDLLSVVKTMKTLAAVGIRQYERATAALASYSATVDLGIQALIHALPDARTLTADDDDGAVALIVFGTDQGLCGQFNERVVAAACGQTGARAAPFAPVAAVGVRCVAQLEEQGIAPAAEFSVPAGVSGIAPLVADLLLLIDRWRSDGGVRSVWLAHNRLTHGVTYRSQVTRLLPLDRVWLARLTDNPWESRALPTYSGPAEPLFSALVQQHLFVTLSDVCAASLAAEDAGRLAAMQNAQRNIEDRLDALNAAYHHLRQQTITAELLDIVAGYEAVIGQR